MLNEREHEELIRQLCATAEVMGSTINPGVALLMASDLSGYDFPPLARALARCRTECSRLTLKNILDRIDDGSQHPGASEAWARCLAAEDEANTVIWTAEMEQAWNVALPVLQGRDRVGARMAFIQHYERLIGSSAASGHKPQWKISQGFDAAIRHQEILRAVETGLLPAPLAEKFLPAPDGRINISGRKRVATKIHEMVEALAADRKQADKARRNYVEHGRAERLRQFDEQFEKQQINALRKENGNSERGSETHR